MWNHLEKNLLAYLIQGGLTWIIPIIWHDKYILSGYSGYSSVSTPAHVGWNPNVLVTPHYLAQKFQSICFSLD